MPRGLYFLLLPLCAGCLDFDRYAILQEAQCPSTLPEAVCVIEPDDFSGDLAFRASVGFAVAKASCEAASDCMKVQAFPGQRNDVRSIDAGPLGSECAASIRIVEATSEGWSFLELAPDTSNGNADRSRGIEVAVRAGEVRFRIAGEVTVEEVSQTPDTLRIRVLSDGVALDALAGDESVACSFAEFEGSGDYRVGLGIDATDPEASSEGFTTFDDYGS